MPGVAITNDDVADTPHRSIGRKILHFFASNMLLVMLLVCILLGIVMGIGIRFVDPPLSKVQIKYLEFPGYLLMNMLQLLILPLIFSSLVTGLANLDAKSSGKIGARAVLYYFSTTLIAVIIGIILVVSIRPGSAGQPVTKVGEPKSVDTAETFLDLIRNMFPSNIIEACFRKVVTAGPVLPKPVLNITMNSSIMAATMASTIAPTAEELALMLDPEPLEQQKRDGMNVLGIVVFSIFFGIIVGRMGEKGRVMIQLFDALCEATMTLVKLVIWYSPIGIMFLIAAKVVEMDDPARVVAQLGMYGLTVLLGLAIHGFIILPIFYFIVCRTNPYRFIYGIFEALMTALGTASSSASLPVTMRCLEEKNGLDSRIIKFMAPIGATINMDGTALYEAVACIFIAQFRSIPLDFGQIVTISLTATAAAIGAAGVPQAGLVTLVIVLTAAGLPTDDVTLIIAIDWFLDRFRTMVNVLGDSIGCGIVQKLSKKELEEMDIRDREEAIKNEIPPITDKNGQINIGYMEDKL